MPYQKPREQWETETHATCAHCDRINTRDILGMPKHVPSVDVGYCKEEREFVCPRDAACWDWGAR